jgi:hypothetical protein
MNEYYNQSEQITEETPLDILIRMEEQNSSPTFEQAYREASISAMRVIKEAIEFITNAPSPVLAAYGVAYALNTTVNEKSMRKRCEEMNLSHNAISSYCSSFKKALNL